jgi:drug/metabolite transporter (DMT)-like permease
MSCSVILFNKWLYNGLFSFPLTLTCIHMFFASTVTAIMRLTGKLNVPSFDRQFYLRNIIPIGFLFACSLGLSNLAAVRLSVAFVQMIKALMPMMTLAVSVIMGLEKATTELAVVVSIMSFGVMIASYGEIHFEIIGFAFQLGSIVTESSRLVATQSLLQ